MWLHQAFGFTVVYGCLVVLFGMWLFQLQIYHVIVVAVFSRRSLVLIELLEVLIDEACVFGVMWSSI